MAMLMPSSDPIAPSPYQIDTKLRTKKPVSYEISSGSEDELAPFTTQGSTSTSPENAKRKRTSFIDLIDDGDDDFQMIPTPPPRQSLAGHSLRQSQEMSQSIQARENADRPRKKMRILGKAPQVLNPQKPVLVKPQTERMEVRERIANETAKKRARFFITHKHLFLPLLPEDTTFEKKFQQLQPEGVEDSDLTVPYEVLSNQPAGIRATMKPYQLLGLSFLVYLQRNGLSGILGDEMGLGKTLQTLSLFQYIKEQRKVTSNKQLRPSLVVCPLSVLSSWMAESKKWAPELKVIRFHGPVHERSRLKQIASGEIDQYGNETLKARKKQNARLFAKGKEVIDLEDDNGTDTDQRSVDVVITTYEGFLAEQAWFKRAFVWDYVVLDEGHKIKNDMSLIAKALQGLSAEYRLILTGTPLQNNMLELWALLHWLYPEVFTERTASLFKTSFDLTKGQVDTSIMDHARRLLEVIMLRRMKNSPGVDLNLPPKTDVLLYVPLTPMQRFFYKKLLSRSDDGLLAEIFADASGKEAALASGQDFTADEKAIAKLEALEKQATEGSTKATLEWTETKEIMRQALEREQVDDKAKGSWRKLMNILMQLRKCCNHPYTLPHTEPDPYYLGDHVIKASGKFILLDKIIQELVIKQKKKVLIFSGFTRMLDCTEDFLAIRGGQGDEFNYIRLDGRTSRARRNLNIRLFNEETSNYRVMLISTRAGGLGINLATASDVIILDHDWNPQIMLQAEARSHRIGQKNPVTVYKLCTQGTVEEQMLGRIQKKLYLSAKVTESMRDIHFNSATKTKKGPGGRVVEAEEDMPQLGTTELMSLVRRGAQTLAHPEIDVNEMMGWDWATMLDKCKDRPADHLVARPNGNGNEDEKKWLSQIEQVQSRLFEGKKHSKAADANSYGAISQEWAREARRVGKETTVMVDGFAINKESMSCGDWEAVPTMAGKDPRLAEPKREKKAKVINQEVSFAAPWMV